MLALRTLIMAMIALTGLIGAGLIGPNRSAIEAEYGLSHSQFGTGIAVIQIFVATAVLLTANRLKRFASLKVLMVGLALQALAFSAIYFTRSVWAMALSWAMIILALKLAAVSNNIAMDLWPHHPRRGVMLLHSFNAGGKVVGPVIAAACLIIGWRLSFLSVGAISLALLAAFYCFRDSSKHIANYADGPGRDHLETNMLTKGIYWLCIIPFALISGGEVAFVTLAPTYFETVKGLTPQTASLLLTIHLLGLMCGRFLTAAFNKKVSNNTIIAFCLSAGVFVFPAIWIDHWLVRNVSLFLLGLTFSATWPTCYAQVTLLLPGHKEILIYGVSFATVIGWSICILISSVIADYNLAASLIFGPVVLWLFGAMYFTTRLAKATIKE